LDGGGDEISVGVMDLDFAYPQPADTIERKIFAYPALPGVAVLSDGFAGR
jgi:hypothetical protein